MDQNYNGIDKLMPSSARFPSNTTLDQKSYPRVFHYSGFKSCSIKPTFEMSQRHKGATNFAMLTLAINCGEMLL